MELNLPIRYFLGASSLLKHPALSYSGEFLTAFFERIIWASRYINAEHFLGPKTAGLAVGRVGGGDGGRGMGGAELNRLVHSFVLSVYVYNESPLQLYTAM